MNFYIQLAYCLSLWNILGTFCQGSDSWSMNQKLRKDLLKNYDKLALPNINANSTTTVKVKMIVRGLAIDEDNQMLVLNTWMVMEWQDERLKWDYKDYGNLNMVHFADHELWKPDIQVYNNARTSEFDHYKNVHLLVYDHDGTVLWVPPAHFEVTCPLDLKFWPFDVQYCTVDMGSWTTNGWQLDIELFRNASVVDTENHKYYGSNTWKVLEATQQRFSTKYSCCDEPYVSLHFNFKLQRITPTFAAAIVVPAVVIPLMLLLQFVLPVDHPKRITIGCVCAILVLLELLFMKMSLPKLGTSVPLVVQYFSQSFVMVMLTIAVSAILGRLAHPDNPLVAYPPPEIIKKIMTGIPATILCLRNHASKVGLSGKMAEDGEVLDATATPSYTHEWLFLAKAGDRIAVIIFIAIYIFSLIGYISPIQ